MLDIDKEWLRNQYENEYLTIEEIAKKIGSNYGSVRKALLAHKIEIRNSHLSARLKKHLPIELEDKKWLEKKYVEENLSLTQIGNILNVEFALVNSTLRRHGIYVRSKSEGQKLRHSQNGCEDYFIFNKPVIEGSLLGDGSLKSANYRTDSYPAFHKGNIGYDHIMFVANLLFSKDADKRVKERSNEGLGPIGSTIFRLSSLTHPELLPLFREWYPSENNFKKIIPESLNVDENVLLHWFMDDGYSYWYTRNKKYRYLRVQFATQCFDLKSLEILIEKVKSKFGLNIQPRFHQKHGKFTGHGYFLELSQSQNVDFFDIIGACPVPSMKYKWKLDEKLN